MTAYNPAGAPAKKRVSARTIIAFLAIVIFAVTYYAARWSANVERAYHDRIYQQCINDGKPAYYCDSLAWQATRDKYK